MTISEMQNGLIRLILETHDKKLLKKYLDFYHANPPKDWWDEISDHEKEMIRLGEKCIERGELVTNEEVQEEIIKILKKQP